MSKIGRVDDVIALKTILFCQNFLLVSELTVKRQHCRIVQHLIDVKRQYITLPTKNDQNLMTPFRKIVTCWENCEIAIYNIQKSIFEKYAYLVHATSRLIVHGDRLGTQM